MILVLREEQSNKTRFWNAANVYQTKLCGNITTRISTQTDCELNTKKRGSGDTVFATVSELIHRDRTSGHSEEQRGCSQSCNMAIQLADKFRAKALAGRGGGWLTGAVLLKPTARACSRLLVSV